MSASEDDASCGRASFFPLMPDQSDKQPPPRGRRSRITKRFLEVLFVVLAIALGWQIWKARELGIAGEEAKALGWRWSNRTALDAIRSDWRATFRASTWFNDQPSLTMSDDSEFDSHTELVRRLAPRKLHIHDVESWTDLTKLRGLKSIHNLNLGSGRPIVSLNGIESLTHLEKLFSPGRDKLRDIEAIRHLTKLKHLTISLPPDTTDLSAIAGLKNLKSLVVIHGKKLNDVTALSGHPTLSDIALYDVERLPDLTPLTTIPNLTTLSLSHIGDAESITTFPSIPGMKTITIPGPSYFPKALRDLIKTKNPTAAIFSG